MGRKHWIVAAVVAAVLAAAAVAASGWWPRADPAPSAPAPPPATVPTAVQKAALQAQADAACRCARTRDGDPGCWAAFDRDIARFPHSEDATICGPASTSRVCFGGAFADPADCIFRERAYGACGAQEEAAASRANGGCG